MTAPRFPFRDAPWRRQRAAGVGMDSGSRSALQLEDLSLRADAGSDDFAEPLRPKADAQGLRIVESRFDEAGHPLLSFVESSAPFFHGRAQVLQICGHVVDGPRAAIDAAQFLLEIHAHACDQRLGSRMRRLVKDRVRRVENSAEQIELLRQDVERETLRFIP